MPGILEEPADGHIWVRNIEENTRIHGCYLVQDKRLGTTQHDKPFLTLTLADRTGSLPGRVWDNAEDFSGRFQVGDIVALEAQASSYRGQIQLIISDLRPSEGKVNESIFVETAPRDPEEMTEDLRRWLRKVKDPHLKRLIDRFFKDREFIALFGKAPAAKNFHHGYRGGLLEHTLAVCRLAAQTAKLYPDLDRDLLLTAAFLHDVGKVRELQSGLTPGYSDEGRLVGHIVLGVSMVEEKLRGLPDFPPDVAVRLKHLILSHHGEYAFGSPKQPKFPEAFVLHLLDDLDAKVNGISEIIRKDRKEGSWTEYNPLFGRFLLKGEISVGGTNSPGIEPAEPADDKQRRLF